MLQEKLLGSNKISKVFVSSLTKKFVVMKGARKRLQDYSVNITFQTPLAIVSKNGTPKRSFEASIELHSSSLFEHNVRIFAVFNVNCIQKLS